CGGLDLPFDFASVRIDREGAGAAGIGELAEVRSPCAAHGGIPRTWIAGAVEHRVRLRVIGSDIPGCSAAVLPTIALPGVVARLTRTGDRPALPQLPSRGDIEGLQRPTR